MDEFGVFVESYGVKVQGGKSTPMANMKARNNSNNGFPSNLGFNSGQKWDSGNFRSKVYDDNDIFGNSNNVDIESVLGGSTNNKNMYDDFDLFGVGTRKSDSVDDLFGAETRKSDSVDDLFGAETRKSDSVDDLFGAETRKSDSVDDLFGAETRKSDSVDDLFGVETRKTDSVDDLFGAETRKTDSVDDLLGVGTKKSGSVDDLFGNFGLESDRHPAGKRVESDDLIPGFGDFSSPTYGKKPDQRSPQQSNSSKSSSSSPDDPFLVFESSTSKANASWSFSESSEQNPGISSVTSSIDELEDFANFKVRGGTTEQPHVPKKDSPVKKPVVRTQDKSKNVRVTINKPSKTTKPKSAAEGHMSAGLHEKGRPEEKKSSLSKKNISPVKNFVDDLMSFGDSVPSSEAFQEVEDESEERRNARFKQHMRTQERMAKALAEKTQRDLQSQNEQEEKHRLAETLNYDIKRWATGKEGNLRALLSSLQHVLWPECGWQPVSLTDLITSTSVKKIYHKATLCVHPDKVQQKGATIRQKYIAEKVFDLLKEAWNKFNTEELR